MQIHGTVAQDHLRIRGRGGKKNLKMNKFWDMLPLMFSMVGVFTEPTLPSELPDMHCILINHMHLGAIN